jgi:hypothetical protein
MDLPERSITNVAFMLDIHTNLEAETERGGSGTYQ